MATYDLEEQEQLEELKTWWKMHGDKVTAVLAILALALAAWQGWNWWQRTQATKASVVYGALQDAASNHDAKRSRAAAGELIDNFSGTSFAGLGALLSAKVQADAGDLKTAEAELGWAAANAKGDEVRDLARLRLAALLLGDKAYDEAMKQLAAEPLPPFRARFAELKGDVLLAQGKRAEAKAAYADALAKASAAAKDAAGSAKDGAKDSEPPAAAPYAEMLQAKLDTLGGQP